MTIEIREMRRESAERHQKARDEMRKQVSNLKSQGMSNRDIAQKLGIHEASVRSLAKEVLA